MAGATEQGIRLGGLVDRRAVTDRLAARALPLSAPDIPRTGDDASVAIDVDWSVVDERGRTAGLSDLAYLARAVVDALCEFPRLNATVGDAGLIIASEVNLGIAVETTPGGPVVPVVPRAEMLDGEALAERIAALTSSARAGTLMPADVADGTFSITDVGATDASSAAPAVHAPQVATLAVDDRRAGTLSLSFDPQVIDSAYAAGFLDRLRELLEQGLR
jgi:2-oxoisovalerate dehydrogenase E2 component (dihydrolipoyl transacylase)